MTELEAVAFAQRLQIAPQLAAGAACTTRDGRLALIERGLKWRHIERPEGPEYDGWMGRVLNADGSYERSSWTADGAHSAFYSESPHDLMERVA